MMYLVCYCDWDDAGWNSVWFDELKAQDRVDQLNKEYTDKGREGLWHTETIEVGDGK